MYPVGEVDHALPVRLPPSLSPKNKKAIVMIGVAVGARVWGMVYLFKINKFDKNGENK